MTNVALLLLSVGCMCLFFCVGIAVQDAARSHTGKELWRSIMAGLVGLSVRWRR